MINNAQLIIKLLTFIFKRYKFKINCMQKDEPLKSFLEIPYDKLEEMNISLKE